MRTILKQTFILCITLFVLGCTDPDERYDVGFDDGYAVGYNTTCEIRATLVEGDWENKAYKRGYDEGYAEGAVECRRDRDNN